MSAGEDRAEAHVIVHGHVQGVYFRGTLQQQAAMRGVAGWVRNRADGAVEAVLQGRRDNVSAIVAPAWTPQTWNGRTSRARCSGSRSWARLAGTGF